MTKRCFIFINTHFRIILFKNSLWIISNALTILSHWLSEWTIRRSRYLKVLIAIIFLITFLLIALSIQIRQLIWAWLRAIFLNMWNRLFLHPRFLSRYKMDLFLILLKIIKVLFLQAVYDRFIIRFICDIWSFYQFLIISSFIFILALVLKIVYALLEILIKKYGVWNGTRIINYIKKASLLNRLAKKRCIIISIVFLIALLGALLLCALLLSVIVIEH